MGGGGGANLVKALVGMVMVEIFSPFNFKYTYIYIYIYISFLIDMVHATAT